jgi:hypothetical protein
MLLALAGACRVTGVTAERVGAHKGVDLADHDVLRQARRRRAANTLHQGEAQLLRHRIDHLRRKAARMPIGNGRRKASAEADRLQALSAALAQALEGRFPHKLHPELPTVLERRVVRLINDIAAAGVSTVPVELG